MAMATRVEGNKVSHGDGNKSIGNGNKGDRQATMMATKRVACKRWKQQ